MLGYFLIAPRENLGVAAAQNQGIEWAKQQGATHVLLLDQDSLPHPDMVARLSEWNDQLTNLLIQLRQVGLDGFPDQFKVYLEIAMRNTIST